MEAHTFSSNSGTNLVRREHGEGEPALAELLDDEVDLVVGEAEGARELQPRPARLQRRREEQAGHRLGEGVSFN